MANALCLEEFIIGGCRNLIPHTHMICVLACCLPDSDSCCCYGAAIRQLRFSCDLRNFHPPLLIWYVRWFAHCSSIISLKMSLSCSQFFNSTAVRVKTNLTKVSDISGWCQLKTVQWANFADTHTSSVPSHIFTAVFCNPL